MRGAQFEQAPIVGKTFVNTEWLNVLRLLTILWLRSEMISYKAAKSPRIGPHHGALHHKNDDCGCLIYVSG